MAGFVIIHDAMERAMQRDLDALRDSLPEAERHLFEAERHIHRQEIVNFFADHGYYPDVVGVERAGPIIEGNVDPRIEKSG